MKVCTEEGCETKIIAKGLCWKHYRRLKRTGTTKGGREVRICSMDGCTNKSKNKGLCPKHHQRKLFQQRRAEGLCYRCGKVKTDSSNCDECRVIVNEYKRKNRAVRKTS